MKYKLNEDLTDEEKNKLNNWLKIMNYSDSERADTLKLVKNDSKEAEKYKKVLDNLVTPGDGKEIKNEPEVKQQNKKETVKDVLKQNDEDGTTTANNLIDYFEKNEPKAFEIFKKGVGNHLEDHDFPFARLIKMPAFAEAIGVQLGESLTEASVFEPLLNLGAKRAGEYISNKLNDKNKDSQKKRPNRAAISNFISAYNALLDVDKNIANKYLDNLNAANKKSILCNSKLYRIDKDQIPNALNVDIAAWLSDNKDQRNDLLEKLYDAVDKNKVDELSTYNIRSKDSADKNDTDGEKILKNALKILKQDPEVAKKFIKELGG